ncbi:iron reductase [Scytonema hofmannii PCC 7110]|uniref:Iron reductase n=1 Tax=Scytonema hofmannii PCC 7110 TaxID=128403 RepID=A0A139XAM0_9CYAN|nr:ferric reductase-like transmembrane domain-containing protein [Scytonema hofmannii]KYC41693.1 iron reductase [Scytonema hofmannii PCC 7110]
MLTMDMPLEANILGFLALTCYILTLLPTMLRIVFPQTKETGIPQVLLKHRRSIGILAFVFTVLHSFPLIRQRNIDLLDLKTSWIYIQGIATFIIFALLTITSNDWSVKKLKKNWKKLHQLTYFAMFLITWHIWDKMSGHWTYLTPIGITAISGVTVLFLYKHYWIQHFSKKQKQQKKVVARLLPESKLTVNSDQ